MIVWKYSITMTAEKQRNDEGEMSNEEYAETLAAKLSKLPPEAQDEELAGIILELQGAEGENAVNDALDRMYNWADEGKTLWLETTMPENARHNA